MINLVNKMPFLCFVWVWQGESGEVIDYLKKVCFHGKELDKENLILELGDLMWYFANLLKILDISFDDVLEKNIEKLLKRYPNGFERRK